MVFSLLLNGDAAEQPRQKIYHLKAPNFPQFRFEYHPGVKKVYLIRLEGIDPLTGVVHGEPIADEIETEGAAWMTALVWLRGYREAKRELSNVVSN